MAHYVNVTKEEVEKLLLPQGFQRISLPNVVEMVYAKRMDRDGMQLSLRVYTGIQPSGQSRDVGKDAMRCVIFWRQDDGTIKMVGGSKRVHRVEGWRKNLQSRIDAFEEMMGPKCPACSNLMVERTSKSGTFYGCTSYPSCKATIHIKDKKGVKAGR